METLSSFRNLHAGETIIVCGCGESLNDLAHPEHFITIGVNDVGRRFQPTYLVVVNPRQQFSGDRFRYVETSEAEYLFTQLDLGVPHPHVVKFCLGTRGGMDFSDPDILHYTQNSPYVALCLAVHMGAKRIGLIGVDFTDNHFFARTGRHHLTPQLPTIDAQYCHLGDALRTRGIEVFNLSRASRLTAFPKISVEEFAALAASVGTPDGIGALLETISDATSSGAGLPATLKEDINTWTPHHLSPKVFGVNYHFLAGGDVFSTGLRNGAEALGVAYDSALWDDPRLPAKVEQFQPDLIFVVHGRRFVQKWGNTFRRYLTAVWLVDEPYEVDDTMRWSGAFQTVFVNDPNTISRHRGAHYLPVCFDPRMHRDRDLMRVHRVGFIGGYNETRERYLNELAGAGLLSYVVGGPWKSQALRRLCLGTNVPPERTTELYQQTQVVVNVFRDLHHFNREHVPACSMNPRIYEALACGALVVSEERAELFAVFPELPTFDNPRSMARILERLLSDEPYRRGLLEKSRARLAGHAYSDRLAQVLRICLGSDGHPVRALPAKEGMGMNATRRPAGRAAQAPREAVRHTCETPLQEWLSYGNTARVSSGGEVTLSKPHSNDPGSETGLVSVRAYNDVELSFELWLDADTWFIAKVHQLDQLNQKTNSYHIVSAPTASYVARHHCVLGHLPIARGVWQKVSFRWMDQLLEVSVNNAAPLRRHENLLQSGYCFIGVKGGRAELKQVQLTDLSGGRATRSNEVEGGNAARHQPGCEARTGKRPQPGTDLWPFTAMPRRNLIYHIWPVRGSMWTWNLDQLKSRLDLFNGHRILGIVQDDRSEPPERVQEYLAEHGFEFVIVKNDERGEAITFPLMMQRVASEDPNEITLYAHAKGVKYEPNIPLPVRRWAEVQYRVTLDNWLTVRDQLQRFAMTGPFKMLGRFRAHRHLADWHYSGTYFWLRNSHVFSRNYVDVPQFYGGVETWPGTIFQKEETACLFMENLRQLPYHEQFWRNTAEYAFRQWESGLSHYPPPPDLVQPLPYKGYTAPRMEQKPDEFEWWVDWLLKGQVSRVLTVGSKEGGVEWHLAREFFEHGRKIEITSIEKNPTAPLVQTFGDAERRFQQSLNLVIADSTSASIRAQLADQYDAVFIDGDHSYRVCRSDFMLAKSLKPRLIGLHDIVDSDWHACARCCVSRLWAEVSQQYRTEHQASGGWGGIGVVILA